MLDLNIPTFIFSILNLAVVYIILKKFVFVPVTKFLDKRKSIIADAFNEASLRENAADEKIREYEQLLKQAEERSKEMYAKAMEKARSEHVRIIDDAKAEAEKIKKDGYREIEKEKEMLTRDIKAQVTRLAILIATKLISENMNTERNRVLVRKYLTEEDVA